MCPVSYRLPIVFALMVALFGSGYWFGYSHEHAAWKEDIAKRSAAEAAAIASRNADNEKLAAQQAANNERIQKEHDEELSSVRARLSAAERMRKPAFCSGSSAPAKAESPASSDAASPQSGVLSESVDGRIKALIQQTEEVAATARACQAFVRDNGMEP